MVDDSITNWTLAGLLVELALHFVAVLAFAWSLYLSFGIENYQSAYSVLWIGVGASATGDLLGRRRRGRANDR